MERAACWPEEAQAELVPFLIDTEARPFGAIDLETDEDRERIERSLASAGRSEFATDEQVAALFSRHPALSARYTRRGS